MIGTKPPFEQAFVETTQRVTLRGITWQTYKQLLSELGDRRTSRLTYSQGILEVIMPSDRHETHKKLIERMIETLTEELNLPAKSFGSTTLNREDLEKGAEPDSCYYIQNVSQIRGRTVNLASDPPPDLVVEVDISNPSKQRMEIYQQLGIPEIWRYSGSKVQIYHLQEGEYRSRDVSPTFPIASTVVINQFLEQAETQDDTTLIRSWRQWIQQQIKRSPSS
jgi:Uma2 family endonuclease